MGRNAVNQKVKPPLGGLTGRRGHKVKLGEGPLLTAAAHHCDCPCHRDLGITRMSRHIAPCCYRCSWCGDTIKHWMLKGHEEKCAARLEHVKQ